jgi:Na+/proline symporter
MGVAYVAYRSGSNESVVNQVLGIAGTTFGLLLGLFVLGSSRRPVPSWAALAGMVCGFLAVLAVWLPAQLGNPILAWPWFAPVGTGTTVVVALLLSALSRKNGPPATPPDGSP